MRVHLREERMSIGDSRAFSSYLLDRVVREYLKCGEKGAKSVTNHLSMQSFVRTRFTRATRLSEKGNVQLFQSPSISRYYLSVVSTSSRFTLEDTKIESYSCLIEVLVCAFTFVPLHPSRPAKPEDRRSRRSFASLSLARSIIYRLGPRRKRVSSSERSVIE